MKNRLILKLMIAFSLAAGAFAASPRELDEIMADELVPEVIWNLSFYLDTLNRRGPAELDVSADQAELIQLYNEWNGAGQSADTDWTCRARAVSDRFFARLESSKDLIYKNARESKSQQFPYRCGLSLDGAPGDHLRDCALFGFRVARLGTQYHWSHKKTVSEQIEFARQALDDYDKAGIKVVLQVTPDPGARNPEDMAFDEELLPTLNKSFYPYNWNSKRRREFTNDQFQQFVQALGAHPAVREFKMGNEPFWSTRLQNVTGFDQATVGCSPQRWRQAILSKYGSYDNWAAQFEPVIKQRQYSVKTAEALPWKSIQEVGVASEKIDGLTFVDFLKQQYGTLDALNAVWYGADKSRWIQDWSEVFPPVPEEITVGEKPTEWGDEWADLPINLGKKKLTSWRPKTEDIPAWMDWVAFFPYCINNALLDGRAAIKQMNPELPTTCNAVGVHFLTDYLGLAPLGLRPWIMSDGLDSLAVDFYVMGYIQPCLRAMAAVADGRPINIHEAGGTSGAGPRGLDVDPKNTTFTTLFSFAYGADSLLFWRKDHTMEPVLMHAVCRATEALENADLQRNSSPLTDPVALVYSGTSLRYFYAKWGHSYLYTTMVQVGVAAANKLQWQYKFFEERALENGIPDGQRVLVVPGAVAVSDAFFEAVTAFLNSGGTLIATDDFGRLDEHGRPRDAALVRTILKHPNTQITPLADLRQWRDQVVVRNDDVRFWSGLDEPDWLQSWEAVAEAKAPRTVTCITSSGARAGDRAVAVRKSSDALYVFVDPWARNISLTIRGQWTSAQDFYSGAALTVESKNGGTVISGVNGPAVICLRAK